MLLALLAGLIALTVAAQRQGWLDIFLNREKMQLFIEGFGIWGPLVFIVLQIVQVVISFIPGNITTVLGGTLFGSFLGFVYSYVAIILGSIIAFLVSRKVGHAVVRKMVGAKSYDRYYDVIHSQGTLARTRLTLGITMVLPFFPDDVICMLCGVTALPFWQFLLIIALTRPLGLLFAAAVGAGALNVSLWGMGVIAVASIALGLLTFRYAPAIESRLLAWVRKLKR